MRLNDKSDVNDVIYVNELKKNEQKFQFKFKLPFKLSQCKKNVSNIQNKKKVNLFI